LNNVFQEFTDSCQENAKYLYACGYLDNSVRIFDLNEKKKGKGHLVLALREHSARVTCIKFTKDYAYFFSCDADGIIRHYQLNCHLTDSMGMRS
jgi:WD40 repeat protein